MSASDTYTESLFTMSKLEDFIPQSHPLRPIRKMVNEALAHLEGFLTSMYAAQSQGGRHFVTSMTASVVSGGSKIAGRDSHPQERRHLFMAHVELRRSWTEEKKIQGVLAERTIQHSNLKLDMKIIVTTLV
jgi:hypothetical protein